jgi:hypothetical protein
MALAWLAPLLHHQSPLFNDYEMCLKNLMPPLEIQMKNTRLTSKYDLFVNDHIQLRYMH